MIVQFYLENNFFKKAMNNKRVQSKKVKKRKYLKSKFISSLQYSLIFNNFPLEQLPFRVISGKIT